MADPDGVDVEEEEEEQQKGAAAQKMSMGNMDKVVADREMDTNKVQEAMRKLAESTRAEAERQAARDKELAKIEVNPEDVDIIANQFLLEKAKADRILREHGGDVVAALSFLVNEWPQDLVKGEAGRIDSESYLQPVWKPLSKKKPLPPPPATAAEAAPASSTTSSTASTAPATSKATATSRPASAKPKGKKKK